MTTFQLFPFMSRVHQRVGENNRDAAKPDSAFVIASSIAKDLYRNEIENTVENDISVLFVAKELPKQFLCHIITYN